MQPLDYSGALDYLIGLGTRHKQIKESRSGSFDPDPKGASKWPLFFIEEEPEASELNPGADIFSFAFQILTKPERQGGTPTRVMLQQMKVLGDQLVEQIRRENMVVLHNKPSKLAIAGTGSDSLTTGWRYEVQLQVINSLDRQTNEDHFEPLPTA
ncbi:hypothetical protein [Hymenobacter sp. YC55]|uniref:hypothetical protein n=1 Tax=Hymenobacter sp. YC55 TaxID=3034019 RepID=UPI0023F73FFB|nr:hypothetical protein [Hymenobacter sp. YC55]MDF7810765.1 hypothetical protein [Hymenobacter sp. YC55]